MSLYGTEIRTTSSTPLRLHRLSEPNSSTSPTSPTMVRETPRLTKASPPAVRTRSTIAFTSSWVASGAITTTIGSSCRPSENAARQTRSPGPPGPGLLSGRSASAQGLAGDRPDTGPVAIPKPELLAHGSSLAHRRRRGRAARPFPRRRAHAGHGRALHVIDDLF